jgi:hypothetical protein
MSGKFAPKEPVVLNPPKDDPISPEELAAANGEILMLMTWWMILDVWTTTTTQEPRPTMDLALR